MFLVWSVLSIGSEGVAIPRNDQAASTTGMRGGNENVSNELQKVLQKAGKGPLYDYPTSFTQEIMPVSILISLPDESVMVVKDYEI